jgi:hypothetical protein
MVVRLTARLAAKIHTTPATSVPLDPNPFADWSAHVFTAARVQYLLVTNTVSLYSVVLFGRGVTDSGRFLDHALSDLGELLREDGFESLYERHVVPSAGRVIFGKALNRAVTGSMNDLVRQAQFDLVEQGLAPFETAQRLNEAPMSYLEYDSPRAAFAAMERGSGVT